MTTNPLRIYLDQNKWIDLESAFNNRPSGNRYKFVLEKLRNAVRYGKAIVPLSGTNIIETRKRTDLWSRRRLSQVMSSISQGWTLAPTYVITPFELRVRIAKTFGHLLSEHPNVFGLGIPFACGMKATLQTRNGTKVNMPENLARRIDDYMSRSSVMGDFMNGGDESNDLLAVENYRKGQNAIVKTQEQFRGEAKPYGHTIHKRAYVANLTSTIQPKLIAVLSEFGKTMRDFLDLGQDRLMTFFSEVPTLDVETELAIARTEYWNRGIDNNDSADITFLSVAIPYCDIVVTERFWRHVAKTRKLDRKYRTTMLDDLAELETQLV